LIRATEFAAAKDVNRMNGIGHGVMGRLG
jgi:hypothetical protein